MVTCVNLDWPTDVANPQDALIPCSQGIIVHFTLITVEHTDLAGCGVSIADASPRLHRAKGGLEGVIRTKVALIGPVAFASSNS